MVDANATHRALIDSIDAISDVTYEFVEIPPVDDQDGGQPGGNIRVSYLYNPDVIQLRNGQPGSSTDNNEVLPGPELKFNPGRIQPVGTDAWASTRKPLVAAWETVDGENLFFTVNVHFSSKGGSSSLEGNFRPPINGAVDEREAQAQNTAVCIIKPTLRFHKLLSNLRNWIKQLNHITGIHCGYPQGGFFGSYYSSR